MFAIFRDTSPSVEGISIDEAFLDVRGMRRIAGTAEEIARKLKREVLERVGLPITVGVACTKHLAKVASAVAKPDGLLVVEPGASSSSCTRCRSSGCGASGRSPGASCTRTGITTVGRRRRVRRGRAGLDRSAGRPGATCTRSQQPRPAAGEDRPPAAVDGHAARDGPRADRSFAALDASLIALVDRLTRRMRTAHRVCRTVVLRLRFDDFTRATRSHTLAEATAETDVLLSALRELLLAAMPIIRAQGITLMGITFTNLQDSRAVQLVLPFDQRHRPPSTRRSTAVRARYGADAITRAVLLGRDPGISVPLLR